MWMEIWSEWNFSLSGPRRLALAAALPAIVNIAGAAYALKDPSPTTGKGGIAISFRCAWPWAPLLSMNQKNKQKKQPRGLLVTVSDR